MFVVGISKALGTLENGWYLGILEINVALAAFQVKYYLLTGIALVIDLLAYTPGSWFRVPIYNVSSFFWELDYCQHRKTIGQVFKLYTLRLGYIRHVFLNSHLTDNKDGCRIDCQND